MPISKSRPLDRQPQLRAKTLLQPPRVPETRTKRFLKWLLADRLHQLEFAVSLLVGLAAIVGWIYDALRQPEIHASTAQLADPFELPFSLHNPSFFFDMKRIGLSCSLYDVRNFQQSGATAITLVDASSSGATVAAGATKQYICPLKRFISLGQIATADIRINVKFYTLGFARSGTSDHFTWTARTGQWTEGTPIK